MLKLDVHGKLNETRRNKTVDWEDISLNAYGFQEYPSLIDYKTCFHV